MEEVIVRDNRGRFVKGQPSGRTGKKLSEEHKQKLREAKLRNPVRYWQGKRRLGMSKKGWFIGSNDYKYIAYSLIEDELLQFLPYKEKAMPEHVIVWIRENRRAVPKGCHIHHKNLNKLDNKIENLELMSQYEHSIHHHLLAGHVKRQVSPAELNSV